MGRPPRQRHGYGHGKAFFKILFGDFSSHLLIPPAFRRLIDRNLLCESLLRGPTGQCWNVKVEVDENNMFFFREGWEKFAKDHSLEAYDFLTFNYDGKSQFDVKIYGKSTVEKITFPALENPAMLNKERDRRGTTYGRGGTFVPKDPPRLYKKKVGVVHSDDSSFKIIFMDKRPYKFSVEVPGRVVRSMGLRKLETVRLEGPDGKLWRVRVCKTKMKDDRVRVYLGKGWSEFWRGNNVKNGDTCKFEVVGQSCGRFHVDIIPESIGSKQT